ncbi:MAG: VWA domain-containing protein [Phycisphaerales bacterium]|nr:VWA domain-containing protein [Phycisphaerales bacterium]
MIWHQAWMLVLLALAPLIWWRWWRRAPYAAVRFSSIEWLKRQGRSWRVRLRAVLPALRTAAVVLLVVALARPQKGNEETRILSEGVAIQLVVDRSSSMNAMDFSVEGQQVDRLTAVKKVVHEFVSGGKGLDGRPNDLIGMITFAGYADGNCPLTLDHAFLLETLDQIEIVDERSEDGTAIGDALALAVERLRELDKRPDVATGNRIKSKVIVLLTDGENNAGAILPAKAAELAKTYGIKVYSIGAGTEGYVPIRNSDPAGFNFFSRVYATINEGTLKEIASIAEGKYWWATDTDSLRGVYAEIDALEKSETEEKRYSQYAELATEWVELGSIRLPPILAGVLAAMMLEIVLANTGLRKTP